MITSSEINNFITVNMQSDLRWVIYLLAGVTIIPLIIYIAMLLVILLLKLGGFLAVLLIELIDWVKKHF